MMKVVNWEYFINIRVIMKFEVINDKNIIVMNTTSIYCIPNKEMLILMSKAGYRFRLDGKIITTKKLNDMLKEIVNDKND